MKKFERILLLILLLAALVALAMGMRGAFGQLPSGKWLSTSGYVFALAGIIQLDVSGLFERAVREYANETKYPYGPPSYITRQIIDNPDRPFRTRIRNGLFFDTRTGFYLVLLATFLQAIGTWL